MAASAPPFRWQVCVAPVEACVSLLRFSFVEMPLAVECLTDLPRELWRV